jgi:hypothetical protein
MPLEAVPERLRVAVSGLLAKWGYLWEDLNFAGTAALAPGKHWRLEPGSEEVWVFAVTAAPLSVGDELESAGGRAAGVAVSAFSGGVIPVTPYQARVYECLGRGGRGRAPERQPPSQSPTTADTAPATPDRRG